MVFFNGAKVEKIKEKYEHVDFSKSIGIHLRFGDKEKNEKNRRIYYIPRVSFYEKALSISGKDSVLVFSDDIAASRRYLEDLKLDALYIEGNEDWEDLYLMTKCKDLICTGSTFSWWGAWLNNHPDKKIFVPKEGAFRPGGTLMNRDYWPKDWIKIKSLRLADNYMFIDFPKGLFEKILG